MAVEKLEGQLKEWAAKIDEFKARAETVKEEKKAEYRQQVELLNSNQEAASKKLHDLKEAVDEAWQSVKTGVDNAWDELKTAVDKAAEKSGKGCIYWSVFKSQG